ERVKRDAALAWPLHVLTIDTRWCARCVSELDHRGPSDTLLRDWVIVSPDSQSARRVCERFDVARAYIAPIAHWEYERKGGVLRWYDKSSPHSSEFRGGYQSLDSAVMSIARAREREVAYPVVPIGGRSGPPR
ncbi:MAG: hypothetical protein Q8K82_24575, partial [Gemmatimonadaceae bacterium]|nr:hypothetical protein [Gemmatimonadaceae bacterium]